MLSNLEHAVASSSPINWLPLELLQNIFLYYLCGDNDLPETLLFVCRHWCDVAISFPILWSNIDPTSLRINPKWTVRFIRARCLRSYPLPLNLDLGVGVALDAVVNTPTLLDRCTIIHIRTPEQWRTVESRLPRLTRLVISCRVPVGKWKEVPTLQSLNLEGYYGLGDICPVVLLKNIIQLEATYSPALWPDIQKAASLAPKLQVLRLGIIKIPPFKPIPHAIREPTLDQVTHLVLRYANISPEHTIRHPPSFEGVPCLTHLEILLYHLRNINGLLTFDHPTVARLTVIMFANPTPAEMKTTEDPADIQGLLDLMKGLPNLKNADLTVTPVIMASLRAELGRNPSIYPPLSIIRHYLPTP